MPFAYRLFFTDRRGNALWQINPNTGSAECLLRNTFTAVVRELADPYGLSLDARGRLLVADRSNDRILRFEGARHEVVQTHDADGHRAGAQGQRADRPNCPCGVYGEDDGAMLVAFETDQTIYRVQPDGTLELVVGVPAHLERRRGAIPANDPVIGVRSPTAVLRSGNAICYIERAYQRVCRFQSDAGVTTLYDQQTAVPGSSGTRGYPTSIAADGDRLYIADAGRRIVACVDQRSLHLIPSDVLMSLSGTIVPTAIALAPDGILWITDDAAARILGVNLGQGSIVAELSITAQLTRRLQSSPHGSGLVCAQIAA